MSINIDNDLITAYIRKTSLKQEFTRLSDKQFKNRYLNALLRRYLDVLRIRVEETRHYQVDNNTTSSKHIYMFEIYEELDNLDLRYDDYSDSLPMLIEKLDKETSEDNIYNIQLEQVTDLVDDLYKLKDCIEEIYYEDRLHYEDSINTAICLRDEIIERYFLGREKIYKERCKEKYKENTSSKFTKRKIRQEEYFNLLNQTPKMKKRDIAEILGVKPSAVTQFCKRHNIK